MSAAELAYSTRAEGVHRAKQGLAAPPAGSDLGASATPLAGGFDPTAAIDELFANNRQYAQAFDRPMSLGVRRKLAVITCMDSRLVLSRMLGCDLGDIEMIRNAGGRITPDVLRSLLVSQEVPELSTRGVLIIHHTDCGGQAAVRHYGLLLSRIKYYLDHSYVPLRLAWKAVELVGEFVPAFVRDPVLKFGMRAFEDPYESVASDVRALSMVPFMPRDVPIVGAVYDVNTGQLTRVAASHGPAPAQLTSDTRSYQSAAGVPQSTAGWGKYGSTGPEAAKTLGI